MLFIYFVYILNTDIDGKLHILYGYNIELSEHLLHLSVLYFVLLPPKHCF